MPTVRDDVAFDPRTWVFAALNSTNECTRRLVQVGMQDHADFAPHHLSYGQRRGWP